MVSEKMHCPFLPLRMRCERRSEMKKFVILSTLLLTACGTTVPISNQIYAVRASLTVAEKGAYGYVDQPLCGTESAEGRSICSRPSVIKKIKIADSAAQTAINAAEEAQSEESLAIAQTAFKAMLEITNTVLEGK